MKELQPCLRLFHNHLEDYKISIRKKKPKELYEPIHYVLSQDAKYIRPLLCLLSCKLFGNNPKEALNAALAIELFHNFSLVHDDILDNSDLRRGKPTIHKKWNNNIAILAGDVLLVEAFRLLSKYPANISLALLDVLSKAAAEICEGQQDDMNFEIKNKVSSKEYLEMIRKKTSVLLGTSMQMGAIVTEASREQQKKIYAFGETIGLSFQITDDWLDTFGQTRKTGKKIGNDILTNKKTFLLVTLLEKSDTLTKKKIASTLKLNPSEQKINQMIDLYKQLDISDIAQNYSSTLTNKAFSGFEKLIVKDKKTKALIIQLSKNLLNREK